MVARECAVIAIEWFRVVFQLDPAAGFKRPLISKDGYYIPTVRFGHSFFIISSSLLSILFLIYFESDRHRRTGKPVHIAFSSPAPRQTGYGCGPDRSGCEGTAIPARSRRFRSEDLAERRPAVLEIDRCLLQLRWGVDYSPCQWAGRKAL